jgi:hypothetical protein
MINWKTRQRFVSKTEGKESGCIEWTACKLKGGYGQFKYDGKVWLAHRFAWMLENGDIPEGMHVLHKCDNPKCVNTYHLFLGTHAQNMADRDDKGRHAIGEAKKNAKLTESDIVAIRSDDRLLREIAADYGVSQDVISQVKRRKAWRHVH